MGWVCGSALLFKYILLPYGKVLNLRSSDFSDLITILLGLLGLGAMRTYEKVNGAPPKD